MSLLAGLSQQGDSMTAHDSNPAAHGIPAVLRVTNAPALLGWRRSIGKAKTAGGRPAVINIYGDSIAYGITENGTDTESTVDAYGVALGDRRFGSVLQRIINARLGCSNPYFRTAADTRQNGGVVSTGVGLNATAKSLTNTAQSQTHVFTGTRFEIGYYDSIASDSDVLTGPIIWNVDSSGNNTVTNGGQLRKYNTITTPDLASGAHSIVVSGGSATASYITHFMGWDHMSPGVCCATYGKGGNTAGDFLLRGGQYAVGDAAKQSRMLAAISQQGTPDLVVVGFAHNDARFGDLVTFSDNLDAIIAATPVTTSILLYAPPPPPASQVIGEWGIAREEYWGVLKSKAVVGSRVCYVEFGDFGSWADWYASGNITNGSVHPTTRGYAMMASELSGIIAP